ncbi:MAG: Fis family transcriptional regulator [Pseudonocardia sp.]|nr:Fis family transcriptional regulator [Pseudonocardia sp.]
MTDSVDSRYRIAVARADFLEGASDLRRSGVADHVAASWRRSASSGVAPSIVDSPYFADLDFESRLVRCAEPVIDQLAEQVADVPMCVALTDSRARLLARKDGTQSFGRVIDRVSFAQGFGYAEGEVGTNGVGTVLEAGHSVHIVGAEHYVDSLQAFACAGAPVRDPFSGRIEGVLDISCFAEQSTPLLHSLVRSAAAKIEHNLVADRDQSQQALFDLYSRVDARSRAAVLAVGPLMTVANRRLQALLASDDRESLQDHVQFLMHRHTTVDDRIVLPSGTCIRFRGSTVAIGGDVAGMVGVVNLISEGEPAPALQPGRLVLPAAPPASPRSPERPSPASTPGFAGSSSPAWRAAAATVDTALTHGDPVIVLGEPGSGRLTLLQQAWARHRPDGEVVAIAADEMERAPRSVAERVAAQPESTLFVLLNIDQVSRDPASTLVDCLVAEAHLPMVSATSSELPASSAGSDLLALFAASATVPPLRHRGADLPGLARALLTDLVPHREIRLSPTAQRVLSTFGWPGNIRQLREALAVAVRTQRAETIEVTDLPAYCQSTPRSALRPVDQAERDAIVAGLRAAGGNRKAAATSLGLARSTLYRKIRQYGITD